ncbi:MAG: FIG00459611: hypothetical protein [uncultured Paraburkholderia sp.]|nr:MAG: FIG00459611: hypothetical protein [uncultured Paraburkholderia sp.]CAH2924732.1 MAG: FIG00459611: hypothetical protein [uncultured Paraburkholderia sp.]
MKFRQIATYTALVLLPVSSFAAGDSGCATLVGTTGPTGSQSFQVRDGEPADLVSPAKTVHGKLIVMADGAAFRAYWQADNSQEKYVLANAGTDAVRLISTPPQGSPAKAGEPGTILGPPHVLSCPAGRTYRFVSELFISTQKTSSSLIPRPL